MRITAACGLILFGCILFSHAQGLPKRFGVGEKVNIIFSVNSQNLDPNYIWEIMEIDGDWVKLKANENPISKSSFEEGWFNINHIVQIK